MKLLTTMVYKQLIFASGYMMQYISRVVSTQSAVKPV